MSARRVMSWGLLVVLLCALAAVPFRGVAAPLPPGEKSSATGPEIEVQFIDGSRMRVKLLDEKLELVTKHGTLQIATADVRRVEFATRIPQADADKIRVAVLALGSPEHKVRVQAATDLKAIGPRSFAALTKATKHDDPEVAQRADDLVEFLKAKYSDVQLEIREQDVVHTDDSKIAGQLSAAQFRIGTFQFGELRMKVADVRSLGDGPDEDDLVAANAQPAPHNMSAFAGQFNKTHLFTVVGAQPNTGTVYGTDQYTLDSYLGLAAVHAGVVKPGQTAVVKVKVTQSPQGFTSSTRNGVFSNQYGFYQPGAYEFVKKKVK